MITGTANYTALVFPAAIRSASLRLAPVALSVAAAIVLAGHISGTAMLILAVTIGLPHGAFDHEVARRAFARRHGNRWWHPFLVGYLVLVSAMLFAWWAIPTIALSLFLTLSVVHFGDQDAPSGALGRPMRIVAHGGAPIIVSAACHPGSVEQLLAALLPAHAHAATMLLSGSLMMLWAAAAGGTLIAYVARWQADDKTAALDIILISLLFAIASPLIAFSLYFAAIHAPRAFTATMPAGGIRMSAMVLPLAFTTLGLALGSVIFAAGPGMTPGDNVVRTAFLLLGALTVPHMWLGWRARTVNKPAAR